MKLDERIEVTERGNVLNLAGDYAEFKRSFDTTGHSGKEIYNAQRHIAKLIKDSAVVEIHLPYLSASLFFIDLLKMKKADYEHKDDYHRYYFHNDDAHDAHDAHDPLYCRVVLVIPAGVNLESVDRTLFDKFNEISSVTCEIRNAVVTYESVSADDLGAAPRGFAPL